MCYAMSTQDAFELAGHHTRDEASRACLAILFRGGWLDSDTFSFNSDAVHVTLHALTTAFRVAQFETGALVALDVARETLAGIGSIGHQSLDDAAAYALAFEWGARHNRDMMGSVRRGAWNGLSSAGKVDAVTAAIRRAIPKADR